MLRLCAKQGKAVGASQLAEELLGPWSSAPRAAHEDYERFVRLVAQLLGGEAPAEDVQVSAVASIPLVGCSAGPEAQAALQGSPRLLFRVALPGLCWSVSVHM